MKENGYPVVSDGDNMHVGGSSPFPPLKPKIPWYFLYSPFFRYHYGAKVTYLHSGSSQVRRSEVQGEKNCRPSHKWGGGGGGGGGLCINEKQGCVPKIQWIGLQVGCPQKKSKKFHACPRHPFKLLILNWSIAHV